MPGDVLIVGAGPTGLTAAVELARRGVVATLIERRAGPSGLSRAVGILPRSMRILAPSGVAGAIRAEAVTVSKAILHAGDRRIAAIRMDARANPDERLFALAQDRTEAHLRDAFERLDGRVVYGAECAALTETHEAVSVTIGSDTRAFSHVIGADGISSTVRAAMGIPFDGNELDGTWSIADVDACDWPDPTAFQAFLLPRGHAVIVVPLSASRFRVISTLPDALAALPRPMDVAALHRAATFRIAVRQARRYATGRVFLAGDAAHAHSPVGGRGMNLGIADAADLARRLVSGGLEGYHDSRHPDGARVIAASERARRMVMSDASWTRAMLRAGARLATAVPMLERRLAAALLGV